MKASWCEQHFTYGTLGVSADGIFEVGSLLTLCLFSQRGRTIPDGTTGHTRSESRMGGLLRKNHLARKKNPHFCPSVIAPLERTYCLPAGVCGLTGKRSAGSPTKPSAASKKKKKHPEGPLSSWTSPTDAGHLKQGQTFTTKQHEHLTHSKGMTCNISRCNTRGLCNSRVCFFFNLLTFYKQSFAVFF